MPLLFSLYPDAACRERASAHQNPQRNQAQQQEQVYLSAPYQHAEYGCSAQQQCRTIQVSGHVLFLSPDCLASHRPRMYSVIIRLAGEAGLPDHPIMRSTCRAMRMTASSLTRNRSSRSYGGRRTALGSGSVTASSRSSSCGRSRPEPELPARPPSRRAWSGPPFGLGTEPGPLSEWRIARC